MHTAKERIREAGGRDLGARIFMGSDGGSVVHVLCHSLCWEGGLTWVQQGHSRGAPHNHAPPSNRSANPLHNKGTGHRTSHEPFWRSSRLERLMAVWQQLPITLSRSCEVLSATNLHALMHFVEPGSAGVLLPNIDRNRHACSNWGGGCSAVRVWCFEKQFTS